MKYSDRTTQEWKELENFYNSKYKGNLTLPEFLDLNNQEWVNYENHYSNPKDFGINEKDLPFCLGTRLYEFKLIDGDIYVYPYIFGTNSILFDLKRYKNKELFLERKCAEKELEFRQNDYLIREVI